ncbi:MAG: hypothetical protein NT082_02195, partial [Chloroflexi bacterium]|nr:hypothetical protein [Chloroflexota bacterium]
LTAVVKISLKWWNIRGSTSFYVTKQPVFLIVTDAEKSRAFSVTGEEVSLDSLETQYPELSFIKEAG